MACGDAGTGVYVGRCRFMIPTPQASSVVPNSLKSLTLLILTLPSVRMTINAMHYAVGEWLYQIKDFCIPVSIRLLCQNVPKFYSRVLSTEYGCFMNFE